MGSIMLLSDTVPWLSLLLLLVVVSAAITLLLPANIARLFAMGTLTIILIITLVIVIGFDATQHDFQWVERTIWIETLNVHYFLGVDGLSVLFLPFTALLFLAVVLASWNSVMYQASLYYALLLLLTAAILGVFLALDTLLFMLFWELTLLPLFFLISLWGTGANRRYASVKYTLLMMAGGLPLLMGFIISALQHPLGITFDYLELLNVAHNTSLPSQTVIFLLLLLGFAFKIPLFPLHTWLPTLAQEGPIAIVATLVGLKIGAYALLRFALPLAPDAAVNFQWLLVSLGMLGLLYGAIAALKQTNLRTMLAYASLSHVGLVVLGIATFNQQGIQGAVFQLLNFSLISAGLFLILSFLHQRTGSTHWLSLGGIAGSMPLLAGFFFFLGVASLGLPGTSGLPAELLLIIGILEEHTGAGLVTLFVVVLNAAYFMSSYRQAFLGTPRQLALLEMPDLKPRELLIVFVFSLLVIIFGFYPQGLLNMMEMSSIHWEKVILNE